MDANSLTHVVVALAKYDVPPLSCTPDSWMNKTRPRTSMLNDVCVNERAVSCNKGHRHFVVVPANAGAMFDTCTVPDVWGLESVCMYGKTAKISCSPTATTFPLDPVWGFTQNPAS